jgi:capsular polysaccharide export protein
MIEIHNNERILLLQGPMGNFFTRFAAYLRSNGTQVWKINFNGGDWLFYRDRNTINYRNTMEECHSFYTAFYSKII